MTQSAAKDLVTRLAGISAGTAAHDALAGRADVMAMTQETHDAALIPADPGGLSHAVRAALAARVALLSGEESLAGHYRELLAAAPEEAGACDLADPTFKGEAGTRHGAMIAYTDLATVHPKDADGSDIDALKAAGISDADIVRLAELNAFLAYQTRLIVGLKLLRGAR
jgi:uncharacterized protein YciW